MAVLTSKRGSQKEVGTTGEQDGVRWRILCIARVIDNFARVQVGEGDDKSRRGRLCAIAVDYRVDGHENARVESETETPM